MTEPGLCDGCDTVTAVQASDDGRGQFCATCLPVANDPRPAAEILADAEPCTSRVRIAVYNGVERVVRCQREPHYARGPHRGSLVAEGTRGADHPGADPVMRAADVTVEWSVE